MGIKIDWSDIANVLIALLIFEVLKKLFLDSALDKMKDAVSGGGDESGYEVETYENLDTNSDIDDTLTIARFEVGIEYSNIAA